MARRSPAASKPYEEFVFWVRRPSVSYSFSLQHDRRLSSPYDESLSLTFLVECLYPKRCEGRETEAHFFGDPRLIPGSEHRRDSDAKPRAVGSIRVGKARFEVSGFLAPEVCWRLGAAMAVGTITSMTTNGQWPTKGHGYLNSISFHGPEFDPVAYIG